MERPNIYYQPIIVSDDGTNLFYDTPKELRSYDVFLTEEDAKKWCYENGYPNVSIFRYEGDDIEGIRVLDSDGMVVAIFEE